MSEGPMKETSYWFPGEQIIELYRHLPVSDRVKNIEAVIADPILVVTHDDVYDPAMVEYESKFGIKSTFFLLAYKIGEVDIPKEQDIQLHFDKENGTLSSQIEEFGYKIGYSPLMSRTHRLYWRSDNTDLAHLALSGFVVDSTKSGIVPYKPCVQGRILPIWEVPFSISDGNMLERLMASYTIGQSVEMMFVKETTPIVAICHPPAVTEQMKMKSCFEEVCESKIKYGYKSLTMRELYEKYLKPLDEENGYG